MEAELNNCKKQTSGHSLLLQSPNTFESFTDLHNAVLVQYLFIINVYK